MGRCVFSGLAMFTLVMIASMVTYQGGGALDPQSSSYSFFRNFWCDLLNPHPRRDSELSVWFAQTGLVVFSLTLIPFWQLATRSFGPLLRWAVRLLGTLAAVLMAVDTLTPRTLSGQVHAPLILTAGSIGFVSAVVCVGGSLADIRQRPTEAVSGAATLLFAALNIVLYAATVYGGIERSWLVPTVQKLATVCLLLWMTQVTLAAQQQS